MKVQEFQTDEEVHAVVAAFEAGNLAPVELTHAAHVAIGLAYLDAAPRAEATDRMRSALQHFVRRHQLTGYHETITVFWMKLLAHLSEARYSGLPLWERINRVTATYAAKWPIQAHYSPETIRSPEAKASWVEPDLLPLAF